MESWPVGFSTGHDRIREMQLRLIRKERWPGGGDWSATPVLGERQLP